MGLVDELVHPAILRDVAIDRARELAERNAQRARATPRRAAPPSCCSRTIRSAARVVFRKAREQRDGEDARPLSRAARRDRRGERRLRAGAAATGIARRRGCFGEMAVTDVSRQLDLPVLRHQRAEEGPGRRRRRRREPRAGRQARRPRRRLHGRGHRVDRRAAGHAWFGSRTPTRRASGKGLAAVSERAAGAARRRSRSRRSSTTIMLRSSAARSTTPASASVDLVIEAVFEDLALKQRVLREVGAVARRRRDLRVEHEHDPDRADRRGARRARARARHALLLARAQDAAARGHRRRRATTRQATVTAVAYGKKLGKTVIVVNDAPGFYTTRILVAVHERGRPAARRGRGRSKRSTRRSSISDFRSGRSRCSTKSGSTSAARSGQVMFEAFGARMTPPRVDAARGRVAGRTGRKGRAASTCTTTNGEKGRRGSDVYELLPSGGAAPEIDARRDRRALRAGDGERGGALSGGRHPPIAARRRRRRGVRDRLPAVPRRTVPLRGQRRRRHGSWNGWRISTSASRGDSSRRRC